MGVPILSRATNDSQYVFHKLIYPHNAPLQLRALSEKEASRQLQAVVGLRHDCVLHTIFSIVIWTIGSEDLVLNTKLCFYTRMVSHEWFPLQDWVTVIMVCPSSA
jgi:hypothetical protein